MQHAPEDIGGRRLSGECPISQSLEIKKCCFVENRVDSKKYLARLLSKTFAACAWYPTKVE